MSEEVQNNGYIANTPQVPYVLYDIGLKLSENLENIKELRDYQIVKFGLDSNNNQWFLYISCLQHSFCVEEKTA